MGDSEKWETKFINVNGTNLRVLLANYGCEKSLVLWTGLGGTAEQFSLFLLHGENRGINVVAIDPPGHGESEKWKGRFSEASIQLIWQRIFETLDIKQAIIGGFSYGATLH